MDANLSYDFLVPQRIVFGWGRRREVGTLGRTLGRRALLVCGLPPDIADGVLDEIAALAAGRRGRAGADWPPCCTSRKWTTWIAPRPNFASTAWPTAISCWPSAAGRPSTWPKPPAAMATNRESPTVKDYLEGVGRGLKIVGPPLPVLAMPSTAGTGAEATKNAVISSLRSAVQEEPPRRSADAADRAGRSGTDGDGSAGGHGRQRHGRDHAVDRELRVAEVAADSAGTGGARA